MPFPAIPTAVVTGPDKSVLPLVVRPWWRPLGWLALLPGLLFVLVLVFGPARPGPEPGVDPCLLNDTCPQGEVAVPSFEDTIAHVPEGVWSDAELAAMEQRWNEHQRERARFRAWQRQARWRLELDAVADWQVWHEAETRWWTKVKLLVGLGGAALVLFPLALVLLLLQRRWAVALRADRVHLDGIEVRSHQLADVWVRGDRLVVERVGADPVTSPPLEFRRGELDWLLTHVGELVPTREERAQEREARRELGQAVGALKGRVER